jgi:hypothetical protein
VGVSGRSEQESMIEGVWRYLYPLSQKTSRWLKGTRILQIYVRILRALGSVDSGLKEFYGRGTVTRSLRAFVSGHFEPEPGHSGFSREFHKKAVYSGKFDSHGFYKFS